MADDKLKTGPEPPGPDRPGDAPVKDALPIQEPPVQETDAPGKRKSPPRLVRARHSRQNSLLFPVWVRTIRPALHLGK